MKKENESRLKCCSNFLQSVSTEAFTMKETNNDMCNKYVREGDYEIVSDFGLTFSGMEINNTNIRIWIHERDLASLERVLWEGYGHLLQGQTSTSGKVRKFLEAIPKLLNDIKEVHESAVFGDVEALTSKEYRQPIYASKDVNGISAFHKAVANGHKDVAEYLMEKTDRSVLNLVDRQGRSPAHYAAGVAQEDDRAMYNWLLEYGVDDDKIDDLMHPPPYYLTHGHQIKYSLCSFVPEAPRVLVTNRSSSPTSPIKINKRSTSKKRSTEQAPTNNNNHSPEAEKEPVVKEQPFPQWNKITKEMVSKWIKTVDVPRLEHAVYMGRGNYVKGRTAWNEDVRNFILTVPNIMASIENFHTTAVAGDYRAVGRHLASDRKLITSRDVHGRTALHKAASEGHIEVVERLLNGDLTSAETLAKATEREERSALHYAARAQDEKRRAEIEEIIVKAGGDPKHRDNLDNLPSYYYENEFPPPPKRSKSPTKIEAESKANKESDVENDNNDQEQNDDEDKKSKKKKKKSTSNSEVDAMLENKDYGAMVDLILAGHGHKLTEKSSTDDDVQEFIDNVPAFQGKISAINKAVEEGSLRELQTLLDRKKFALAKDRETGINFLHKAVILGHSDIVR